MSNKDRTAIALSCLRAYYEDVLKNDSLASAISDLISDLLHLHISDPHRTLEIDQLFARAENNFEAEIDEEEAQPELEVAKQDYDPASDSDVAILHALLKEWVITNESDKSIIIDKLIKHYNSSSLFFVITESQKYIYG